LNTEPQPLPTHYSGRFSVHTYDLDPLTHPWKIHNERRAKEFEQIEAGLKQIFTPYEQSSDQ